MNKHTISLFALVVCVNLSVAASGIILGGAEYSLDTLESFKVGPGTTYTAIQMRNLSNKASGLDAYILQVDRRNPYISFSQVLGKDAVIGTERPSAMAQRKTTDTHILFAGTNGDFFITQGDVGKPVGLTVGDSQYACIGSNNRRFGAVDDNNIPVIGSNWQYQGKLLLGEKELTIAHVNYGRADNELVLFNQHNGTTTLTNAYGTEVLVELLEGEHWQTSGTMRMRVVEKEKDKGSMVIPAGKAVLSGHGTMAAELDVLSVGDEVAVEFALTVDNELQKLSQCVGGDNYALIVDNGKAETANFWNENHPRTGFGSSMTGDTVIFCVVDGRSASSVGCTTRVLGEIMLHYGAWKAVNWDGGGSSCMYIRQLGQVNNGSDGSERAVGNAMFAVADVPQADNTIAELQAYTQSLFLPKYGVHFPSFLGYNQYGVLLDTDVQDVTLSCDESTGYIDEQGRFVCLGNGVLTASKDDVSCTVPVRLADNVPFSIRLDSVLVSDDTDYAIEVSATVGKNTLLLQPAALSWEVADKSVCTVSEKGILNGLHNGSTWVYGTLDGITDSLLVHVEIPEIRPLLSEQSATTEVWEIVESGDWQTTLQTDDNGKMTLHMNYNVAGRLPNTTLQLTEGHDRLYSLPEKLEIRLSPNGTPVKELHVGLRANNALQNTNCKITDILIEQDTSLMIDLAQVLETKGDIAAYPVHLCYLTFYWNTKIKGEFTLDINGIWLHYGAVSLGVESVTNNSVGVYPNPTQDVLQIVGCEAGAVATLFDLQGRALTATRLANEQGSIDISALPVGNYILRINDTTIKVIKK